MQELADFVSSGARDYGFNEANIGETFTDIRSLLEHEVKFEYEQRNLSLAARAFEKPGIRVPRLIPELCTPLVTAMTEERGEKATDLPLHASCYRQEVATRLVESLLVDPLFSSSEQALFHADPHAGNLLYDARRNQIVILDWALTGYLSRSQRKQFCMLLAMLGLRDAEGVSAAIHALSDECGSIGEIISEFLREIPISRVPGSIDAVRLVDLLALKGVRFPAQLLMFRKVLFTLDGVLHDIAGSDVSLDEVIAGYLASRWLTGFGTSPLPLGPRDWASLMASASLYGCRLWFQGMI